MFDILLSLLSVFIVIYIAMLLLYAFGIIYSEKKIEYDNKLLESECGKLREESYSSSIDDITNFSVCNETVLFTKECAVPEEN